MRINPISARTFTGTLVVKDENGKECRLDTNKIAGIKPDKDGNINIEFSNGYPDVRVGMPLMSGCTVQEIYDRILNAYSAACQAKDITIKLPDSDFYLNGFYK